MNERRNVGVFNDFDMYKKRIFIFAILLISVLTFGILSANALTISPPLIEINAQPGEVVNQTIKIIADANTEGVYYPSVANFTAKGEEGKPEFSESAGIENHSLAEWIEIDHSPIALKKNERREIRFTINVPKEAEPGGHYGVIFLSTQSPTLAKEQTAIGVAGKLGSLLLVKVAGEIKEEGRLVEFDTVAKKTFFDRLPINFLVKFENTGNVHLKPQGEINVTNMFGRQTTKLLVNEKGGNVLPESIRKFLASWQKEETVSSEREGFFAELIKEKNNFGLGRYKAELILVASDGGITERSTKSFWVIPWRILLISLLVLMAIIILTRQLIKVYNKRIIERYQKTIQK